MDSTTRLVDVDREPRSEQPPLRGYAAIPLVSIEEAIEPLVGIIPEIRAMVSKVREKTRSMPNVQASREFYGLTMDESDAIGLYTLGNGVDGMYSCLNETLRAGNHSAIKPWFLFLKLLLIACSKLPSKECLVWRGIIGDVSDEYVSGESGVWWGFNSCSTNIHVVKKFLESGALRTLFAIQCIKGKCIQAFSLHNNESEILLMPGTYFKAEGKLEISPGVWNIHLQEEMAPYPLLDLLFLENDLNHTSTGYSNTEEKNNEEMFAQWLNNGYTTPFQLHHQNDRKRLLAGYYEGCGDHTKLFMKQIRTHGFIHRLLIIGGAGVGKSSLINLLAGKTVAEVNDGARSCLLTCDMYKINYGEYPLEITDAVGLNTYSTSDSGIERQESLKNLIRFVKRNGRGFTCVIFVMSKGRIGEAFERNYKIIYRDLLKSLPPAILFVNSCEADDPMDQWGSRNAQHIHEHYRFKKIICGTTLDHATTISNLRDKRLQTERILWETIGPYLQRGKPQPIPTNVTSVSDVWNQMQTDHKRPRAKVSRKEHDLILSEMSSYDTNRNQHE